MQYMVTEGRRKGLQEPIIFNGPKVKLSPELEEQTDPAEVKKKWPSEDEGARQIMENMKTWPRRENAVPDFMKAGKFPAKDDPINPFNIWRRPLAKYAYDIKRIKSRAGQHAR